MHPFRPHRPARRIDPLLALSGMLWLAGALTCWLFAEQLATLRAWGAAPLYLLILPASLVLGRLCQLRPRVALAARRWTVPLQALPARRPHGHRLRPPRARRAARRAAA
jgi:hypothetical protein